MWHVFEVVILLCYFGCSVTASYCYPDYCQNSTDLIPISGFQCVLTEVQRGEDCVNLTFESDRSRRETVEEDKNKISLSAYVFQKSYAKTTAFNLSVSEANFHGLIARYQNLLNSNQSHCRRIKFYGNATNPAPEQLYVSCPFSNDSYESFPYRLDLLVTGDTYSYSKQYIFNVPRQESIEEGTSVQRYAPFVYIDTTYAPRHSLHIQPLPDSYNVSEYRIRLINNDTDSVVHEEGFSAASTREISYNFTDHTGVFYFKVFAVHPDCGEYGCANSTTPFIIIQEVSHRLLIMIISTVWIPPVILYVLYHLYKLYRKEGLKRRRKPTCLLIYSPTRLTHINAMNELAKYLRNSNITVIDTLHVADSTGKDPKDCYSDAFRSADVVLVVASPPANKSTVSFIYCNKDNHLFKLLRENQATKEKRYFIVQLPYCKPEDVPEETRHLKKFSLPKELARLVKVIHKMEYVGCVCVSDKDFLDSVKLAKLEMLEEDESSSREARETENLLTSGPEKTSDNPSPAASLGKGNVASEAFATNIDKLDLLGGTETDGEPAFPRDSSAKHADAFRVDELDL
ncbi:uncharacterized protein LOC116432018 [Nomia melanderi]|uniref:uncharacterized protein LOC116432018 n=1 Tax=Nomia melanderi TaxID=2448451 RepID=UPI003FCC774B